MGIPELYHQWFYSNQVWKNVTYRGIQIFKNPLDLWLYQEIISELKPALIIEFGTGYGGSALFFRDLLYTVLEASGLSFKILTVDHDVSDVSPLLSAYPFSLEVVEANSVSMKIQTRLTKLCKDFQAPIFVILDSDHRKEHVLSEMLLLKSILKRGDCLVVEDGNINGHPVNIGFGDGPFEAIIAYEKLYPDDYIHDKVREEKFGFTFAPNGFLIRQ